MRAILARIAALCPAAWLDRCRPAQELQRHAGLSARSDDFWRSGRWVWRAHYFQDDSLSTAALVSPAPVGPGAPDYYRPASARDSARLWSALDLGTSAGVPCRCGHAAPAAPGFPRFAGSFSPGSLCPAARTRRTGPAAGPACQRRNCQALMTPGQRPGLLGLLCDTHQQMIGDSSAYREKRIANTQSQDIAIRSSGLQAHLRPWDQSTHFQIAQKSRIMRCDTLDYNCLPHSYLRKPDSRGYMNLPQRVGDRITIRVFSRMVQQRVNPLLHDLRENMLQLFGLRTHLIQRHFQHPRQK